MASILGFGRVQLASVYKLHLPRWRGSIVGSARPQPKPATPPIDPVAAAPGETSLSTLVEYEIIPRLVASHPRSMTATFGAAPGATAFGRPVADGLGGADGEAVTAITAAEVDAFAPMSLNVEADALLDYVETLLARGVGIDSVLVDLLAPSARRLGEYWEDDRCDFVDVTMGLWRLQEIVHELGTRLPAERHYAPGFRALFASMPGDQHSFGTIVVDELFCREGWLTDRMSEATLPDLVEPVTGESFDLVGLTISCDAHIAALPSVIAAIRASSRNQSVRVMVGGRVFVNDPALADRIGADGTAPDARIALEVAADLVGTAQPRITACG